ncbi:MAG: two-component system, OmpR family, sensor histidine kinase ChvG, partial [Rhodospirillaceae bacterium]|nr:two-component system, OmpR family, sensor histidine kinase ChvG [Rhodospirillaceae bacterium]
MSRFGRVRRSLAGKLWLLAVAFIAVPIALYVTFQRADSERQDLLLRSIQAQGRLVAAGLDPIMQRGDAASFTDL